MSETTTPQLFGLMAEFNSSDDLLEAAKQVSKAGFTHIEGFSPYPIEGLYETLGKKQSNLPVFIFIGGCLGMITALCLQIIPSTILYPYIVGGKPFNSWPAFIPICFELTVLFSALTAVFGMFWLNSLPKPYHPNFNVAKFTDVTKDKFFLVIEKNDPKFTFDTTRSFLEKLNPLSINEVIE